MQQVTSMYCPLTHAPCEFTGCVSGLRCANGTGPTFIDTSPPTYQPPQQMASWLSSDEVHRMVMTVAAKHDDFAWKACAMEILGELEILSRAALFNTPRPPADGCL